MPDRTTLGVPPLVDWDAAIRQHGQRVVVALLGLGLSWHHAQDLAQQAWMRLIERHRDGAFTQIALPGLAIAQARFLAVSDRRLSQARRDQLVAFAAEGEPLSADPSSALDARRELDRVLAAVRACPPSTQAVFYHAYTDPAPSLIAVADRSGLSVQRVRQILCELRKMLRQTMENA